MSISILAFIFGAVWGFLMRRAWEVLSRPVTRPWDDEHSK